MEEQNLNDLPELDKLLSEQEKKLADVEAELGRWRQHVTDYTALQDRLLTLPGQLTHQVTVPLGRLALAPGRLVHTNELLVLLGDNWFAEASAAAAARIADRRRKHCSEMVSRLEREQALFADWRRQAAQLQREAAQTRDIAEPLDEAAEARWRRERRQRVAAARRRDTEERRRQPEPDIMARLDALERREADQREMDRLSVESSDGSDGKLDDDFFADDLSDDSDDDDGDGGGVAATAADGAAASHTAAAAGAAAAGRRSPIDSDDSDDPAPARRQPEALRRRVSFSDKACTVHTYDAEAAVAPDAGPAGDAPPPPACQERPQLSQVFSYKIAERPSPAEVGAGDAPVPDCSGHGGRAERPVSRFRASRSTKPAS